MNEPECRLLAQIDGTLPGSGYSEWMVDAAIAIQSKCFEKHPRDIPSSSEIADCILKHFKPKDGT